MVKRKTRNSTYELHEYYLNLLRESLEDREQASTEDEDFRCSFVPPSSYWTPAEKTAFFRALTRHSRLRPELIQQEIGETKKIWEVCRYIDILDEVSTSQPLDTTSNKDQKQYDFAYHMSDKWIRVEDRESVLAIEHERRVLEQFYAEKCEEDGDDTANSWKFRRAMRRLEIGKTVVLDAMIRDLIDASPRFPDLEEDDKEGYVSESEKETAGEDDNEGTEEGDEDAKAGDSQALDLSSLTAAERKRIRNRLHMRRKRARDRGEELDEDADENPERMRPGRKRKRAAYSPSPAPEDKKKSARGKVLMEKNQLHFQECGVSGEDLDRENLSIFHLTGFAKLMEMLQGVYNPDYEDISLCSELLSLMRAHLVVFLSELIGRLITFSKQECFRTDHTAVFKGPRDHVTPSQVRHVAKQLIGSADQNVFLRRLEKMVKKVIKSESRISEEESPVPSTRASKRRQLVKRGEDGDYTESGSNSDSGSENTSSTSGSDSNGEAGDKHQISSMNPPVPFLWVPSNLTTPHFNQNEHDTDTEMDLLLFTLDEEAARDRSDMLASKASEEVLLKEMQLSQIVPEIEVEWEKQKKKRRKREKYIAFEDSD